MKNEKQGQINYTKCANSQINKSKRQRRNCMRSSFFQRAVTRSNDFKMQTLLLQTERKNADKSFKSKPGISQGSFAIN